MKIRYSTTKGSPSRTRVLLASAATKSSSGPTPSEAEGLPGFRVRRVAQRRP